MPIYRHLLNWLGADDCMTHIVPGKTAPAFSLKSLDGEEFSLKSALQRGPVVLSFFKVSCPVCKFTFPFLERVFKSYGDSARFVGISQDNVKASRDFAREFGVTFPVLIDGPGYPVSNAYGLTTVPTYFLIDQDNTVQVASIGFGKPEIEAIANALADRKNIAHAPVFRSDEAIPVHKPG
jgi:peroxiredoxin